jgi:hypothetical protein
MVGCGKIEKTGDEKFGKIPSRNVPKIPASGPHFV